MSLELVERIYEKISKFKPTDTIGKDLFAENFTASELIEEKLDKMPKDVFSNPNLKWLDPCSGIGNYPIAVIRRLMYGLEKFEPNEEKRFNHIIKNMIYMVEIQNRSCNFIKNVFDGYNINLFEGSYLEYEVDFKFDVVLGNPPYEQINSDGSRSAKNSNLWSKFINVGFEMLNDNGYLLYITPPSWMSPSSKELKNIFSKYNVLFIDIENCSKYFKVGSKFSYYLIKKEKSEKDTLTEVNYLFNGNKNIKREVGTSFIKMNNIKFLPQLPSNKVLNILEKTLFNEKIEKENVVYDSDLHRYTKSSFLSKEKTNEHVYEIIHTPSQTVWSTRPHKNQGKIKVFISLTSYYEKIIIGKMGNTQGMGYVLCDTEEEALFLKNILLTDFFRFVANITRWSNFNVPDVIKSFPKIKYRKNIKDYNEYVFNELNISKEEIEYIKSKIKKQID